MPVARMRLLTADTRTNNSPAAEFEVEQTTDGRAGTSLRNKVRIAACHGSGVRATLAEDSSGDTEARVVGALNTVSDAMRLREANEAVLWQTIRRAVHVVDAQHRGEVPGMYDDDVLDMVLNLIFEKAKDKHAARLETAYPGSTK